MVERLNTLSQFLLSNTEIHNSKVYSFAFYTISDGVTYFITLNPTTSKSRNHSMSDEIYLVCNVWDKIPFQQYGSLHNRIIQLLYRSILFPKHVKETRSLRYKICVLKIYFCWKTAGEKLTPNRGQIMISIHLKIVLIVSDKLSSVGSVINLGR